jgi:hypothetical protein
LISSSTKNEEGRGRREGEEKKRKREAKGLRMVLGM